MLNDGDSTEAQVKSQLLKLEISARELIGYVTRLTVTLGCSACLFQERPSHCTEVTPIWTFVRLGIISLHGKSRLRQQREEYQRWITDFGEDQVRA